MTPRASRADVAQANPPAAGHVLLFREGRWRAEGAVWDANGTEARVEGETTVRHEPGRWIYEGVLRARSTEYRNLYEIAPFSPGARSTHWSAKNAALGTLRGRFVLAGNAILSMYGSTSGRYRGFECLERRDAGRYSARGAMMDEDKVISSWAVELSLVP